MRELPAYSRNMASALHRLHVKQSDLAAALGVSKACVSLWVRGLRKPQPYMIPRIARELGVTPKYLSSGKSYKIPVD